MRRRPGRQTSLCCFEATDCRGHEIKCGKDGPTSGYVLRFTALCTSCVFHNVKVGGNSARSKSVRAIFPRASAPFPSLRHILVIRAMFQALSLALPLLGCSVIRDLGGPRGNHPAAPGTTPTRDGRPTRYAPCVSAVTPRQGVPQLPPSPRAFLFPETQYH